MAVIMGADAVPPPAHAALVRQYELLLVHRHRFVLADVVQCVQAVVALLHDAEALVARDRGRSTSTSSGSSAAVKERHVHKKANFAGVMESIAARLAQLAAHVPVFLGDAELHALVRAVRDFVRHSDMELFWDLEMDAREQAVAEQVAAIVRALERRLSTLEASVASAVGVTSALRKKRDHLVMLVNESMLLLAMSNAKRLEHYEAEKEQLLRAFEEALGHATLKEVKQLEFELKSIETSVSMMLLPHSEICRTIATANAEVKPGSATFDDGERASIDEFVKKALTFKDHSADFSSIFDDSETFIRQLKAFERAASMDAFLVCSSALKLQFQESLDDELFRAYVQDWKDKKTRIAAVRSTREFADANARVLQLKQAILRVQSLARQSRKNLTLDDPVKDELRHAILRVFDEEGGELSSVIDVFA